MMEKLDPWLPVEGIAEYLNVSKEKIYRGLERKTILVHGMGKLGRFKPAEIDKLVLCGGAKCEPKKPQELT